MLLERREYYNQDCNSVCIYVWEPMKTIRVLYKRERYIESGILNLGDNRALRGFQASQTSGRL